MAIIESKIIKSGNSASLLISKELLQSMGIKENDVVLVDEEKLKHAIVKGNADDKREREIDGLIKQSMDQYSELYRRLADK